MAPRHRPSQGNDATGFDFSDGLLTSYDEDGYLTVQVNAFGEESGDAPAGLMHWFGRAARPLDRESGKPSFQLVEGRQGSDHFAFLANDPRVQPEAVKTLQRGGQALYDSAGTYIVFRPDDKELEIHLPDDGRAIIVVGESRFEMTSSGFNLNGCTIDTNGNFSSPGEVTAMSNGPGVKLSTHLHPTGTGPSGAPTSGT